LGKLVSILTYQIGVQKVNEWQALNRLDSYAWRLLVMSRHLWNPSFSAVSYQGRPPEHNSILEILENSE